MARDYIEGAAIDTLNFKALVNDSEDAKQKACTATWTPGDFRHPSAPIS